MNYKSQLKGWAIDRVIEWVKATNGKLTMDGIKEEAMKLADYCYVADEDFKDTSRALVEIASDVDLLLLEHLIDQLLVIKEQAEFKSKRGTIQMVAAGEAGSVKQ